MRKLISFLGTNEYIPCYYNFQEETSSYTRFVQIALYDVFMKKGIEIDEVIIIMTDEAKRKNWNGFVNHKEEYLTGLNNEWHSVHPDKLKAVEISTLQSEHDEWYLFNLIYDLIEPEDEIYFDITHSFRSLPLIALLTLNYARLLKKAKIGKLLYGNFESLGPAYKVKEFDEEDRIAPIEDMTSMLSLFDWTNGVDAFLRTGNPIILQGLSKEAFLKDKRNEDLRGIKSLVDQLKKVSDSIETCRGKKIEEEIEKTKEKIEQIKVINTQALKPFSKLIDKVEDKFAEFSNNSILNAPKIVEWCIQHNLYQQGYTILQESIISAVCMLVGLDYTDKNGRTIVSKAINITIRDIPKSKWKINQMCIEKLSKTVEILLPYRDILMVYEKISVYRNNVNHYEMQPEEIKINKLVGGLSDFLEQSRLFFEEVNKKVMY